MNFRHKLVLFLTLVVSGLALLDGARLGKALGFVSLGVAAAWALGSEALARPFHTTLHVLGWAIDSVAVVLIVIGVISAVIVDRFDSPLFAVIAMVAFASAFPFLFTKSKLSSWFSFFAKDERRGRHF